MSSNLPVSDQALVTARSEEVPRTARSAIVGSQGPDAGAIDPMEESPPSHSPTRNPSPSSASQQNAPPRRGPELVDWSPSAKISLWGAMGLGVVVSVVLHGAVLLLPMPKEPDKVALPLSAQEAPIRVTNLPKTTPARSTPSPSPARSTPAQRRADRAATPKPKPKVNQPNRVVVPKPQTAKPAPAPSAAPSPSPNPTPSPTPSPSPSPEPSPSPTPQGLPALAGLNAGGAACAPDRPDGCYSLPENLSIHSVTPEVIQNSLGPDVTVAEIPAIYENTEQAREFVVSDPRRDSADQVVGYYYVISTQVRGQVGAIIVGSRDRLLSLDAIQAAAGAEIN